MKLPTVFPFAPNLRATATACALLLSACKSPSASTEGSPGEPPTKAAPQHRVVHLDAEEFAKRHNEAGGILLDVRTPPEVARMRIKGSSTINYRDSAFPQKASKMKTDGPIFVYCASGGRSASAAKDLLRLGFTEVYDLKGGIGAWNSAGLPVERSPVKQQAKGDTLSLAAFDTLLKQNPVVLADFHTRWCNPCIEMAPIVDRLANEWKDKAKVLQVDIDESVQLASREKATGVPVFVVYKAGKEIYRHSGKLSYEELTTQLKAATQ